MTKILIPNQIIGVLSILLPIKFSHSEIDGIFLMANAPENNYVHSNKASKVQTWFKTINDLVAQPLTVLESILENIMETDFERFLIGYSSPYSYDGKQYEIKEAAIKAVEQDFSKITQALERISHHYKNGKIIPAGAAPTQDLLTQVKTRGLQTVEVEINRAMEKVNSDPDVAVQYAGNVLEATLKIYLEHHSLPYEGDTLSDLWKKSIEHIGLRPGELEDKDLKKIASGLNSVVDGIMHLRNKKSSSHGKSETQSKSYKILPRHARLSVHAAHTISVYVLELVHK